MCLGFDRSRCLESHMSRRSMRVPPRAGAIIERRLWTFGVVDGPRADDQAIGRPCASSKRVAKQRKIGQI